MKRVLITGADGFIGSNVLQYLLNNTDWVFTIICSWRHHGSPKNVPISNRVTVITHDLRGPIPDIGNFDYILHLASESHVDRSVQDPVNFVENNISSTLQMLEYARNHKCEKFILFSTDEVYGANKHKDWDLLLPTNPYAASKAAQEVIAISYYNTFKLPIIITNANNIIGENQHPEKFIPKIARLIKAGKTIELHAVHGKYGRRYYNPVINIGSALHFILTKTKVPIANINTKPPRYALVGGQVYDNLQMAKLVAKIMGRELRRKTISPKTVRPAYDAFYDEGSDRLIKLGWKPIQTTEEGLQWLKRM